MLSEEALRAKTQRSLVDLLHTELELGQTFAQSALLAKSSGHTEVQAKQHAVKAADTVRHFMARVADDVARTEIDRKLAELDRLISTL